MASGKVFRLTKAVARTDTRKKRAVPPLTAINVGQRKHIVVHQISTIGKGAGMSYQVYQTKRAMTFVITRDAAGAENAKQALGSDLGELRLWKTIPSLDVIGMDPAKAVEKDLDEKGYHVQRSEVRFDEA